LRAKLLWKIEVQRTKNWVIEGDFYSPRGHLVTEPTSAPLKKPKILTPDVDIPVRSPRTGVRTVPGDS